MTAQDYMAPESVGRLQQQREKSSAFALGCDRRCEVSELSLADEAGLSDGPADPDRISVP